MTIEEGSDKLEKFVFALQERMKELDCIYKISSALHGSSTANEAVSLLIDQLPKGFRFTDQVSIRIEFNGSIWNSGDNWSNERAISSDIVVNGKKMGEVSISLINESLLKDEPFLKEEEATLIRDFGSFKYPRENLDSGRYEGQSRKVDFCNRRLGRRCVGLEYQDRSRFLLKKMEGDAGFL